MKPPRGLSAEEAAAWARVATTVRPINPPRHGEHQQPDGEVSPSAPIAEVSRKPATRLRTPSPQQPSPTVVESPPTSAGLDSHWDRRFRSGSVEPDFTLDLHGHTLDGAYHRLADGLSQAKAMGARVVLVIAGKPRPAEGADRATARGAIRRKLLDWLAAGPHGASVAAVRQAHRKHGGDGALYLILKRPR